MTSRYRGFDLGETAVRYVWGWRNGRQGQRFPPKKGQVGSKMDLKWGVGWLFSRLRGFGAVVRGANSMGTLGPADSGGESIQLGRGKIDLLKFCMQRSGAAPASAVEMMGGARCTSCSGGC